MIKKLLLLALAGVLCLPLCAQAQLNISVGDRDYYNHGSSYVDGGYRYAWVPGHWGSNHHWVHGHYARRDRVHVGVGVGGGGIYIH